MIFISYPTKEYGSLAEQLKQQLDTRISTYVCHVNETDFVAKPIAEQRRHLERMIQGAAVFVVLRDGSYQRSGWCCWELSVTIRDAKPILVMALGETPIPPELAREMAGYVENADDIVAFCERAGSVAPCSGAATRPPVVDARAA